MSRSQYYYILKSLFSLPNAKAPYKKVELLTRFQYHILFLYCILKLVIKSNILVEFSYLGNSNYDLEDFIISVKFVGEERN